MQGNFQPILVDLNDKKQREWLHMWVSRSNDATETNAIFDKIKRHELFAYFVEDQDMQQWSPQEYYVIEVGDDIKIISELPEIDPDNKIKDMKPHMLNKFRQIFGKPQK